MKKEERNGMKYEREEKIKCGKKKRRRKRVGVTNRIKTE